MSTGHLHKHVYVCACECVQIIVLNIVKDLNLLLLPYQIPNVDPEVRKLAVSTPVPWRARKARSQLLSLTYDNIKAYEPELKQPLINHQWSKAHSISGAEGCSTSLVKVRPGGRLRPLLVTTILTKMCHLEI
ncbi:jg11890 [Pararge aegeria aegeria]|uniref:Jg11890 protein n=1 Tax=Pararge aegeria aegeria TaxID=348720 RepID=A0A8S4SKB7_9NEOP|nr:jg11890 [Pararge aegeria aegeria]